jgi:hypothetical protein
VGSASVTDTLVGFYLSPVTSPNQGAVSVNRIGNE